ncbi:MAG: retropepsin-like aspartic protease family protein [Gammaproteobacteria bacterium]
MVVGLFKDKAILDINGKQRLLAAGHQAPEGITLISANSKEAVIEVAGKRGIYALGNRIGSQFASPTAGATVQISPNYMGMYNVGGAINGFAVSFMVDTGATQVAMNKHLARRLGIDYRLIGNEGVSSTASGIVKSFGVTLKKVRVGDIELMDVPATVIDGDFPTETLLGMSFLSRVDMDRKGRLMVLRKKW